jgi:hypothetical protein
MTQTYFFANAASAIRPKACEASIDAQGLRLPSFAVNTAFSFDGASFQVAAILSGPDKPFTSLRSVAADSSGDSWLLSDGGALSIYNSTDTSQILTVPNAPMAGLAFAGQVYAITSSGLLYNFVVHLGVLIPHPVGSGFGGTVRSIACDGTTIYAMTTAKNMVSIAPGSSSVATSVAVPMDFPSFCGVKSGQPPVVVGNNRASLPYTFGSLQASPANPTGTAAATIPGANEVALLTGSDPVWNITATVGGVSAPNSLAWSMNGEQVLVTNGGELAVFNLSGGALTLSQTLSQTSAGNVTVTPDNTTAFIALSGAGNVALFTNSLGTWSSAGSITVAGANCVLALSSTSIAIGTTTGIVYANKSGSTWVVGAPETLGFSVTQLLSGPNSVIYVIGNQGGQGYLQIISAATTLSSVNWAGSSDSVVFVSNYQVFVADQTSSLIRAFCVLNNSISIQDTSTPNGSNPVLAVTSQTYWECCSGAAYENKVLKPYVFTPIGSGQIEVYSGGSWIGYTLGVGKEPSAITYDSSGNIFIATKQNQILEFGPLSSGALPSPTITNLTLYTGQKSGVSLWISSLIFWNGVLFATTTASGVLIRVF